MNPCQFSTPTPQADMRGAIESLIGLGYRPLVFGAGSAETILVLMSHDEKHDLKPMRFPRPENNTYPALTPDFPCFHMFERELWEETGIVPEGHPWLKPVRYPETRPDLVLKDYPFLNSPSETIHEVAVGPVHAGVIEPGQFRFLCEGEDVHHLEIQLGFQHRGVRKLLEKGDIRTKVHLAEAIAGDTAIGHALAYCRLVEALTGTTPQPGADEVRAIALEMERVAMHLADLSALAGDIAYIFAQNYFANVRTKVINLALHVCGCRFGKRWLCPGGVNYPIDSAIAEYMAGVLTTVREDVRVMSRAMFNDTGVLSRFEGTGRVYAGTAENLGFVGMAARASGVLRDARKTHPFPPYEKFGESVVMQTGDVWARAELRNREITQSLDFCLDLLSHLTPVKPTVSDIPEPMPNKVVVSIVEGWRGEIVHLVETGPKGETLIYRVVDPSFHNWTALAMAVRNNGISDFPVCNKSFNLSYCGFDL